MAGEPQITLIGNLGKDPEMAFLPSGASVGKFTVAVTPRVKAGDEWKDGKTIWFRVSQWGRDGEINVDQMKKGDKVIVLGRFSMFEYEKDGATVTGPEVTADTIAPVLKPNQKESSFPKKTEDNGSPW